MMANEELAELDPLTRLLFSYLWMLADREGRLEDRPKRIAALALPFDRSADVGVMLSDLARSGFIERYSIGLVQVIQILAFHKHQNPHATEKDSDLPDKNGYKTVNERQKNGCVTGKFQLVNVVLNVKPELDKQPKTLDPLNGNALIPDPCSLIPDPLHTEQAPVDNFEDPVCVVLKDQGIQYLNPSDPEFTRLKSEGADIGLWSQAAMIAVDAGNAKFDYVLGIVRKKLKDRSNPKSANGHANGHIQSITTPGIKGRDPTLARMDEEAKLAVPMPENVRNLIRGKYRSQIAVSAGAH